MPKKQLRKFSVFMAKESQLTAMSKTGFHCFILVIYNGEMNPKQGHSSNLEVDALRKSVEFNPHKSTQELVFDLNTAWSIICCHLKKIGKMIKLGVWFPHTLNEKNEENCISKETSLLSRLRNDLFFKNINTSEGKWVFYDNIHCKG